MVVLLNQIQQERVYKSFQRFWYGIGQMDEAERRKQINDSRDVLQRRVNEIDLQGLHLQEAMIEYLQIRALEEALQLKRTPVPVILGHHFQHISYPELQAVVNRLAVFPASTVPVNNPPPARATTLSAPLDTVSWEVKIQLLKDFYEAVRNGRITHPETIREFARHFLDIENDPEASKNFPYDAGQAARNLLRQAKFYEDKARAKDIYDDNAQADMPRSRQNIDKLMADG